MASPRIFSKQLDPAVLNQMEEPISVSVSRVYGGAQTPIPLPPREAEDGSSYAPGEGWEKNHIRKIEQWLAGDWSGGGMYHIKMVDQKGLAFEWRPYFDPKVFPPRTPGQTLQPGGVPSPTPIAMQSMPSQESEEWPPRGMFPLANPLPSQVPSMSYTPYPFMNTGRPSQSEEERRRFEDRERQQAEQIARLEREKMEERHQRELAGINERSTFERKLDELKISMAPKVDEVTTRRLDKLESLMERLVDKISAPPPAPTGPSPEMQMLMEQNREMKAQQDRDRADQRHREEMAAMERRIEALAARPTGPDPMITLLLDVMKDNNRNAQQMLGDIGKQILSPQDVLNLAKSTSSGVDDLRANVVRTFGEMFDLQKRAFENAAQFLPQGDSPVVRVIEGVAEKGQAMFESWQQSKDAGQVASAKAQQAQARAQEAAINAQREHLAAMAAREERMNTAVSNAAHAPSKPEPAGLSGAAPMPASNVIPFEQRAKPPADERRMGKTDVEWFGGALVHVDRFRIEVARYIEAATATPPAIDAEGKLPGISPEQALEYVDVSNATILQQGLKVAAFDELFMQDRFEDFLMVLLPNAPISYRKQLLDLFAASHGEDDEEGDDDEEEEVEAKPTAAAPPPPPAAKRGPPRQPRA